MSRIGRLPITVTEGVEVTIDNNVVTVKGTKGTLVYEVPSVIEVKLEGGIITVSRTNEEKHTKQLHGTVRANIYNMVVGVSKGYTKQLLMNGTGYKAEVKGKQLVLNVGYSHDVILEIPEGINVVAKSTSPNTSVIDVDGYNKQVLGQFCALIRGTREPEPYLGKGVAYADEHIRRKEGKKAAKK